MRERQVVEMKSQCDEGGWEKTTLDAEDAVSILTNLATRKRRVLNLACPLVLLITQRNITISRPVHTCHRLKRDIGWAGGMLATPIQRQDS